MNANPGEEGKKPKLTSEDYETKLADKTCPLWKLDYDEQLKVTGVTARHITFRHDSINWKESSQFAL